MKKRSFILYPFSWFYGLSVGIRNLLYDMKLLKSESFDVPVICVGNITVGGTGKTPHLEYIINLLRKDYHVAVVSRGYKRESKGLQFANRRSTVAEIGDEPMQISRKFPGIVLAVDADRNRAIHAIMERYPETGVILMDDGFQHRSVKPGLSIILTDYGRMLTKDSLLPYGNLREGKRNLKRADVVVVTKMPLDVLESEKRKTSESLAKYYDGNIYYTSFEYNGFAPVFAKNSYSMAPELTKDCSNTGIILLTGIANPKPLKEWLEQKFKEVIIISHPDHHTFTNNDVMRICKAFETLKIPRKFIVTTEKDTVRLREFANFPRPIQPFCFYLRVEIDVLYGEKEKFDKVITDFVANNSSKKELKN